jgi:hypothetical protein
MQAPFPPAIDRAWTTAIAWYNRAVGNAYIGLGPVGWGLVVVAAVFVVGMMVMHVSSDR